MAKWTIIQNNGLIVKDGEGYENLDVSFLPSDVLVVQSPDGVTADLEKGNQSTETHTSNDENVATSTLSWWSSVSTTWQAAYDAANPPPDDDA